MRVAVVRRGPVGITHRQTAQRSTRPFDPVHYALTAGRPLSPRVVWSARTMTDKVDAVARVRSCPARPVPLGVILSPCTQRAARRAARTDERLSSAVVTARRCRPERNRRGRKYKSMGRYTAASPRTDHKRDSDCRSRLIIHLPSLLLPPSPNAFSTGTVFTCCQRRPKIVQL